MGNLQQRLENLERAKQITHPVAVALVDIGRIDADGWRGDEGEFVPRLKGEVDQALRERVAAAITSKYPLAELLGRLIARLPN